MNGKTAHWADETAAKIIREKGEKDVYVCASGITPSGVVHIGNFREIISVDLVVRALKKLGKNVRFIYSWDDYDVFRKVPANMPRQEDLKKYLRFPITMVPDPWGRDDSYARHHEADVENILPSVGIFPEYLYQTSRYRGSIYAEGIKTALENSEKIRAVLDKFRDEDHKTQDDWQPISIFCGGCNRDDGVLILPWDGSWNVSYKCKNCGCEKTVDLRRASEVKLGWRIDWPMRWAYEGVDFEPAGKDHHSQGGSFDTSRVITKEIYNNEAPVTFRYDFIGIKGTSGKMASSSGNVIDLKTLLRVYTPELVRYIFAGTRPNTEFTISFDLDVLKIYEDYDKTERIAWKLEAVKNESLFQKERRIYELSQPGELPSGPPPQIPFRHLCNLLQINGMDVEKTVSLFTGVSGEQQERLRARAVCASNWITDYAPPEFRFQLREAGEKAELTEAETAALRGLRDDVIAGIEAYNGEKETAQAIYDAAAKYKIEPKALFRAAYQALIGKDQGPRLASFLRSINKDRLLSILERY
ncbi:MAG: lysine--tRNA ligase [Spirochaetaceae bacterium]|jgi:lysyl-tRNA synthetase class 1|nr:lysine--tRNA ligase [Spirochaetaceae bacterium]